MNTFCRKEPSRLGRLVLAGMASSLALGFAMGGPAFAQEASDAPAEVEGERVFDSVTVTARKRAENPQDIPITLDVIGGDYLEQAGLSTLDNLQFSLPGVAIESFENAARVSIRGVGSATSGLGAEDSTSVHQDGVYIAFPGQALGRLFDVDRLEVLKGPQGTLYGRNATAGVVNIVSRRPGTTFGGEAEVTYGSFETFRFNGAVDLPVSEAGGVRLAGIWGQSDGFLENGFGGPNLNTEDYWGFRTAADFDLSEKLSMKFTFQYVEDDSQAPNALAPPPANAGFAGFNVAFIDDDVISEQQDTSIALQFDYDMGDITLRSLTGYAKHDAFSDFDCDPGNQTPLDAPAADRDRCVLIIDENFEQYSQEFQALWASPDGKTDAVAGLYYLNTEGGEDRFISILSFADFFGSADIIDSLDTASGEAYGVFVEVNHFLSDQFRLNVGLRYNYETRAASTIGVGVFDFPELVSGDQEYDSVSGRVGLDYIPNEDTLIYTSISRGFKAGGLIPVVLITSTTLELDEFDPETLWSYEIGVKHELPGKFGILNAAAYYYDYKDIQIEAGVFNNVDGLFFDVDNATEATIWGIDATYTGYINDLVGIDLNVAYINAEFGDFPTFDFSGNPLDYTGNKLPRAPEFSWTGGLNLIDLPLSPSMTLGARLEYNYRDDIFYAADNVASQEALSLINANVQLNFADGAYFVRLSGRNLTDEDYTQFDNGDALSKHGRPREFLLTLGAKF